MSETGGSHAIERGPGKRRDAKPLSEDEFVALDDVPPDGACAGGAVCPARRNVDVAQPLERHGQAERHCRRFVAERPVGVQGLQRTHQVKHALGRRDRAPVRGARVHAPRRSHDLSAFDLPLQARADAGVVGDEERLREFRLREEGSQAPYRSSHATPPLGSGALALRMHYLTAAHCRRTQQAERRKLRREHIVAPKVRLRNRGALLGRQSDMFDGRGRVAAADGGGAAGATRPRAVAGRRRRTKGFPLPFKPVQSARRFRFRGRWFGCASGKGPGLRTRRGLSKRFR